MKHYKAILAITSRTTELQVEIEKLENIDELQKSELYAGYIFIQNDIANMETEINELTETMQFLINQSK